MLGEQRANELQVLPVVLGYRPLEVVELEQVDVYVAAGARDLLEPLELLPEARELLRREHRLELALERAGPADSHTQVAQELAVEVGKRARQVGLDHVQQARRERDSRAVGGQVGRELHISVGREARG